MKIYIVYGSTGEYSDRNEWPVAAYADEALAQCHVAAATRWYQENDCFEKREGAWGCNPFDPAMSIDYTGTHWYLGGVDLLSELPTEEKPMLKVS